MRRWLILALLSPGILIPMRAWTAVSFPAGAQESPDDPSEGSGDERGRGADRAVFREITEDQREAVRRGLEYLVAQQDPHKGFFKPHLQEQRGRIAITALACLSLMANGNSDGRGRYGEHLGKGIRYLMRNTKRAPGDKLDGYISTPGDDLSRMHGHGFATLALAEAYGMYGENPEARAGSFSGTELKECIQAAIGLIERTQSSEGGWYYHPDYSGSHEGSITICELQALRSAHKAGFDVDRKTIRAAEQYLRDSQKPDGSFRYTLRDPRSSYALTGAAISTFHALGLYDTPEIRRGMDYLERNFEQFLYRSNYFYYAAFYAGQAMFHSRISNHWEEWFARVREHLLARQRSDGSWGMMQPSEDHGPTYATAMATLVLQIPYRYLPIYQR
jgi:hypothetical protein